MLYRFVAQRHFVADFVQAKCNVSEPHFYLLRATYDVQSSLESACLIPVSVNWTFSLGGTDEALQANID